MEPTERKGGLPPPAELSKSKAAQQPALIYGIPQSEVQRVHLEDEIQRFLAELPPRNPETEARVENLERVWGPLESKILDLAEGQGFPRGTVEVNLSKIRERLENDPKLKQDEVCTTQIRFLVITTAMYLAEIVQNTHELGSELGPIEKIEFTDGDPHNGKSPCFINFVKPKPSGFKGWFSSAKVSRFVYKPRGLEVEHAVIFHSNSLFSDINERSLKKGICKEPPFKTRQIVTKKNFGLHEFIPGEMIDTSVEGMYYTPKKYGTRMIAEGAEEGPMFRRHVFLEEVLKRSGLGGDSHVGNYIWNHIEGYAEPIDLEVYTPGDPFTMFTEAVTIFIAHNVKKEMLERATQKAEVLRREITEFLDNECGDIFARFSEKLRRDPHAHVRFIPLSTAMFINFRNFSAGLDDYLEGMDEELSKAFKRMGYNYTPSPEFTQYLTTQYHQADVPIFIGRDDLREITAGDVLIATKKPPEELEEKM